MLTPAICSLTPKMSLSQEPVSLRSGAQRPQANDLFQAAPEGTLAKQLVKVPCYLEDPRPHPSLPEGERSPGSSPSATVDLATLCDACSEDSSDVESIDGYTDEGDGPHLDEQIFQLPGTPTGYNIVSPAEPVLDEQELKATVSDLKLFLKQWHFSQGSATQSISAKSHGAKEAIPRFPQLKRLLDVHYGVSLSLPQVKSATLRNRRQPLGRSQFSRNQKRPGGGLYPTSATQVSETRLEKQLRKAVECFRDANFFKAVCCYSKACEELDYPSLTKELKERQPSSYDTLVDLRLCASVCYIRMRQYTQAKDSLETILVLEHAQTEAILILCWSLTANLILDYNGSGPSLTTSSSSAHARSLAEDLSMAKDCLKILSHKPFFASMVTQSALLASHNFRSSLKQNLGDCSSDFNSDTTRETSNSAASNDPGSLSLQSGSQGPATRASNNYKHEPAALKTARVQKSDSRTTKFEFAGVWEKSAGEEEASSQSTRSSTNNSSITTVSMPANEHQASSLMKRLQGAVLSIFQYQVTSGAIRVALALGALLASQVLSLILLNCAQKRIRKHLTKANLRWLFKRAIQLAYKLTATAFSRTN